MVFGKKRSGFTLLELIIVIVVIGVLASIALPRYIRIAEKGRAAEAKNFLSTIRSAQIRYAAQHSIYASTTNNLDVNLPAARYYNCIASAGSSNLALETALLGQCTRLTTAASENPNMGAYVLNITMGGNLSGDATGQTVL